VLLLLHGVKVLVTGATGFIGRSVVRRLAGDGAEVRAFARDTVAAEKLFGGASSSASVRLHAGSIGDPNEVARAAKGVDVVIHAAAVPTHRASPRALSWTNVAGTENVLNAARHAGCARVVHISCADVTLANLDRVNWNEDRAPQTRPIDAHARTKLLAEELALAMSTDDLAVAAIRPAWIWGPDDTTILPGLCREALEDRGLKLIGGGRTLVSTTYIDNLVDAVTAAMTAEKARGRAYYVTDSEFVEMRELLGELSKTLGLPAPRTGLPYDVAYALASVRERMNRPGPWRTDVIHRGRGTLFDSTRAMNELDYKARVGMTEGMKRLEAWAREVGGPVAIAKMERPPATDASVDAQVRTADAT